MRKGLLLAGSMLTAIVVCLALLPGAGGAPPLLGTYRAAVETVLARRGIEHQGVRVVDGCAPSHQFCRHYRGDVLVLAPRPRRGEIVCRWRWTGCALTIEQLGLHGEPLPDGGLPVRPEDLRQLLEDLRRWLR